MNKILFYIYTVGCRSLQMVLESISNLGMGVYFAP